MLYIGSKANPVIGIPPHQDLLKSIFPLAGHHFRGVLLQTFFVTDSHPRDPGSPSENGN